MHCNGPNYQPIQMVNLLLLRVELRECSSYTGGQVSFLLVLSPEGFCLDQLAFSLPSLVLMSMGA